MWVLVGMVSVGLFWSGEPIQQPVLLTLFRLSCKRALGQRSAGCRRGGPWMCRGWRRAIGISYWVSKSGFSMWLIQLLPGHPKQLNGLVRTVHGPVLLWPGRMNIVYHYSWYRVIRFPASRDAALLMNGIRRYHVEYRGGPARRSIRPEPTAEECFTALPALPESFRLVHTGPRRSVFEESAGAMTSDRSVGARAKEIAMPKSPPINSRRSKTAGESSYRLQSYRPWRLCSGWRSGEGAMRRVFPPQLLFGGLTRPASPMKKTPFPKVGHG